MRGTKIYGEVIKDISFMNVHDDMSDVEYLDICIAYTEILRSLYRDESDDNEY